MNSARTEGTAVHPAPGAIRAPSARDLLPDYLETHYWWAYLRPASIALFDSRPIVSAILWGNYRLLQRALIAELDMGMSVLQAGCVYGDLSPRLASVVAPDGRLEVIDIAPIQVANCRRKLIGFPHARATVADAALPRPAVHDVAASFFLLHELPDERKRRTVNALLDSIKPGGKAVFIDYHAPHRLHPLRPVMRFVFAWLEPFAARLWQREIESFAARPGEFAWRKTTYFGGLYQKVVATRLDPLPDAGAALQRRPQDA